MHTGNIFSIEELKQRFSIEHEDQVALMLRTAIAVAEQDDSQNLVQEGEPYETVCRKLLALSAYVQELAEVANSIIEP